MRRSAEGAQSLLWNRPCLVLCCGLKVCYGVLSMCFALVLNELVTTVTAAERVQELLPLAGFTLLFGIIYPASRCLTDVMRQSYAERAAESIRNRISAAVFSMNSAEFSGQDTGEYLNRMTGDVLIVRDQYYAQLPLLFEYLAQFLFCAAYSLLLNPVVGAVLLGMSVVQYFAPTLLGNRLTRFVSVQSQKTDDFTAKAKELLLGFPVIRSYGAQESVQREFQAANRSMTGARTRAAAMSETLKNTNMLVAILMVMGTMLTAGYFVVVGDMLPGTLLTVFYIANRFSAPIMDFADACVQIRGSRGVRDKLQSFLQIHPERRRQPGRPISSGIAVRDLSFSYDGAAPVLSALSCSFEMGKKYLILGESGCGKSTLLKVLAGQYPSRGVFVDGTALEQLPDGQLAGRLVLVGQQPYVFRRTVADNIDFLGTGDRKRVLESVEKCCLGEFVSGLPQGVDTLIDEEQRQLSGGQKARIGLARAICARPDVLLLDEATSALDPETAREIERMILELDGVLVIHVAHKPAPELMARYDAVLTMQKGRITRVETAARQEA